MLSQLGVDSYALVGNDTGGWIARELALIDTARVSPTSSSPTPRSRGIARRGSRSTRRWRTFPGSGTRPPPAPQAPRVSPVVARLRRLLPRPRAPRRRVPRSASSSRSSRRTSGSTARCEFLRCMKFARLDEFSDAAPRAHDADALRLGRRRPDLPRAAGARDGPAVPERRRLPHGARTRSSSSTRSTPRRWQRSSIASCATARTKGPDLRPRRELPQARRRGARLTPGSAQAPAPRARRARASPACSASRRARTRRPSAPSPR